MAVTILHNDSWGKMPEHSGGMPAGNPTLPQEQPSASCLPPHVNPGPIRSLKAHCDSNSWYLIIKTWPKSSCKIQGNVGIHCRVEGEHPKWTDSTEDPAPRLGCQHPWRSYSCTCQMAALTGFLGAELICSHRESRKHLGHRQECAYAEGMGHLKQEVWSMMSMWMGHR